MKINDDNFNSEVLENEKPVLVEFWASWCPPCKIMAPLLDKFAEKVKDTVKVVKINVDMNQVNSEKYNIQGVPTFILFKNGEEVARKVGALSESQLDEMIK